MLPTIWSSSMISIFFMIPLASRSRPERLAISVKESANSFKLFGRPRHKQNGVLQSVFAALPFQLAQRRNDGVHSARGAGACGFVGDPLNLFRTALLRGGPQFLQ